MYDVRNIQTLITVDFFNHDTQSSSVCEGLQPIYNLQVAYRIPVDEFFIKYMETEFFKIEIYASLGQELPLIGKCLVPLKDLIFKNQTALPGVSAVLNTCESFFSPDSSERIGSIMVKLRMRHPIIEAIRWYREKMDLYSIPAPGIGGEYDLVPQSKKLIINIVKCIGLTKSNPASFVYYKLFNLNVIFFLKFD